MLTLWDNADSSNALKARFLLAELALPYERRDVPLTQPRPPAYLAVNPLGGIPALDDDGFMLAESQAILRYLAARERRDDLYPADARERARVDELLDRFATRLRGPLFRHEAAALGWTLAHGFDPSAADPEAAARIEQELQPHLALFEGVVGERAAVLDRFTIADCALAPVLHRTRHTGLRLDAYPRLSALREAVLARPAWAAADPGL
ncbi:MAG TPA: glutathione S-transferase family protein [Conexibacter sp.]|jgi:glutathione S-transferase